MLNRPCTDHFADINHILVDVAFVVPPGQSGLLRRAWLPLAMAEPATFYAMSLMAATHHAIVQPQYSNAFNVLTLKGLAISAINEALADPERSMSDSIMCAVMKMASYEALFGEEETFQAHFSGLERMVRMRGGLANLGMDGLMERTILWIDSNASHYLGCEWMFDQKRHPTPLMHPAIDPTHFGGQERKGMRNVGAGPTIPMAGTPRKDVAPVAG